MTARPCVHPPDQRLTLHGFGATANPHRFYCRACQQHVDATPQAIEVVDDDEVPRTER